ncbi:MAG: hypothetical protein A3J76_01305 [Candidatus Moranbacteria bacterium RBG_13_45_13]|nr:MAG: hypothetical protein A3J76_01305 [Candidatus Moranbacteria bacterium RBG_13_45_13]
MKEKIIWGLIGALVILFLAGIFLLGKWYGAKKCGLANTSVTESSTVQEQGTATVEKTVPDKKTTGSETANQENTSESTAVQKVPAGWKTFTNSFQGYKFSYPANGKIAQLGTSGREEDVDSTDGACVSLKLDEGYVHILGKTRSDDQMVMCLRTGVGTEWGNIPDIEVEVFGKKYTAHGMGTASASAGYKKEFYFLTTDGGEKIEFGIEVNEKYAPELTYEEAKAEVLAVLKTLKYI